MLAFAVSPNARIRPVIVLDSESNEISYIENTFSPKHLYIKADEIKNYSEADLKNNFVCIITDGPDQFEDKKNMSKVVEELKASSVQIKKQNKKIDEHAITDAKMREPKIKPRVVALPP